MKTELDKKTERIADDLVNEFIRLGVSTADDPCLGLMTRIPNVVTEIALIDIFDGCADGDYYDGEAVLAYLKTLKPEDVSLSPDDLNNIWQLIEKFEVYLITLH